MAIRKRKTYRNEWKYLISPWEAELLQQRLEPYMQLDPNAEGGSYMIRSLYFDDYWDSAYNEKMMGVDERQKWRIRIYNYSDDHIKLERKQKRESYIWKESANLTRNQVGKILDGDYGFLLSDPQPLCREFYIDIMTKVLRPKVIVDYDRVPYVLNEGTVRITFDYDVRAAYGSFDIFDDTLPTMNTMEADKLVLEVKYTEFLPDLIKKLIPPDGQEFSAVSKYVLCYEKVLHLTDPLSGITFTKENRRG